MWGYTPLGFAVACSSVSECHTRDVPPYFEDRPLSFRPADVIAIFTSCATRHVNVPERDTDSTAVLRELPTSGVVCFREKSQNSENSFIEGQCCGLIRANTSPYRLLDKLSSKRKIFFLCPRFMTFRKIVLLLCSISQILYTKNVSYIRPNVSTNVLINAIKYIYMYI